MESVKHYFSKRYVLYFLLLYGLWYPGSFLIYVAYNVTNNSAFYVAMNVYFPLLIFLCSFLYFRKSLNDWNDRFFVAFGWIALTLAISALLVPYVYGFDWTSIMNIPQIRANWSSLLAVFFSGILVQVLKKSSK